MSAVGLNEMSKKEICEYAKEIHTVVLKKTLSMEDMKEKVIMLDDLLEFPLEVKEEVYCEGDGEVIYTIVAVDGDDIDLVDDAGEDYTEDRANLTRVTLKGNQEPPEEKEEEEEESTETAGPTTHKYESLTQPAEETEVEVETMDINGQPKPLDTSEDSYRVDGGIVIGNVPADVSSTIRKTGVTHVLDNEIQS